MRRDDLPNRRNAVTLEFQHTYAGQGVFEYTATLGYYKDGRVGEVFVFAGKSGSGTEVLMRDSAILLSLALQHGCAIETIKNALTKNTDGQPSGPLGTLLEIISTQDPRRPAPPPTEPQPVSPDAPIAGSSGAAEPVGAG